MTRGRWLALSLVVLGTACGDGDRAETGSGRTVRIAAYEGEQGALPILAADRGYYKARKVDVQVTGHVSGRRAMDALLAGESDMATCADFVFVNAAAREADLRVIATVSTSRSMTFVGRRESDIESSKDMRGKRVGVSRGTNGEYFLTAYLAHWQMSLDDVVLVDVAPPAMEAAFLTGEVDGVVTWDPIADRISRHMGSQAIRDVPGDELYYFLLVAKESFLETHRKETERILSALLAAQAELQEDTPAARTWLKSRFGFDESYVDGVWRRSDYRVVLGREVLVSLEVIARWLIDTKLTTLADVPDYTAYVDKVSLLAANREAVLIDR